MKRLSLVIAAAMLVLSAMPALAQQAPGTGNVPGPMYGYGPM
jgi:hypothetical protein